MNITIKINTDNAAFADGNSGTETARILRELAGRLEGDEIALKDCRPLRDNNGNRVGEYKVAR